MNEKQKDQFVGTGQTNNRSGITPPHEELEVITVNLTSRIETRNKNGEGYHYAFFKSPNLVDPELEFPVIFKDQKGYYKPTITKGSIIQLTGTWSPGKDRPSFTCSEYKIINSAEPIKEASHDQLNLYQKLHLIQSQTGQITKAEENKFGKYKYFTEQQALNILKPLLAEQKLTLTFSDQAKSFIREKTESGWAISYLKQAILTNSENPEEQLTFHFWATGQNQDIAKAKGCAETYAIKYFSLVRLKFISPKRNPMTNTAPYIGFVDIVSIINDSQTSRNHYTENLGGIVYLWQSPCSGLVLAIQRPF